jgi:ATP-dependent RNA helicase DeaD
MFKKFGSPSGKSPRKEQGIGGSGPGHKRYSKDRGDSAASSGGDERPRRSGGGSSYFDRRSSKSANGPKTGPSPRLNPRYDGSQRAPAPDAGAERAERTGFRSSSPSRSPGPSAAPGRSGPRPPQRENRPFGQRRPGKQQRPPRNASDFQASAGESKPAQRSVIKRAQAVAVAPAQESSMHFSEMDLPEEIERALAEAGFEHPTPIQEQSLPHTLNGFDLMGCAQTGTGKTAAFTIPMITRLLEDEESLALVLAPTRELAAQIMETLKQLTAHARHIRFGLIIGGASFSEQVRMLKTRPRIIVSTPGRLVDHLKQRTVDLRNVKFLVLDEADRMFDMGFAPQINKIVAGIPPERQTLLFSATFNKDVKALALRSLRDPKQVFIGAASKPAAGVEQEIVETTQDKKFSILLEELNTREGSVLLFVGMKYRADRLAQSLEEYGHSVARIHGGRSMGQRNGALKDFRDQRVRILVATDIAARGLDIPHVAHVINFDLPKDPEDYIHRIGRTARAGAVGHALSFVTREEQDSWKGISRLLASHK